MDSNDFFLSAIVKEEDLDAGLPRDVMDLGADILPGAGHRTSSLASMALNSVMEVFLPDSTKSILSLLRPLLFLQDSSTFRLLMASTLFFFSTLALSMASPLPFEFCLVGTGL